MTNSNATATRIVVSAALFAAASAFAGKKDVRFYLNGVRVEPAPCGVGVLLIGCDGHRLAVLHDPDGEADGHAIIPTHKSPAGKAKAGDTIECDGITARYSNGAQVPAAFIDGRYPDWQAVVPLNLGEPSALSLIHVNPDFIGECGAVCAAYGFRFKAVTIRSPRLDCSMLVTFGDNVPAFVVVMPLRTANDKTGLNDGGLPRFMERPLPVKSATPAPEALAA